MSVLAVAAGLGVVLMPSALASHTLPPTSVTIAGSLQSELGCSGDWQSDCALTHLTFDSNDDVWQGTFMVPSGSWEYKAALNNSWTENYGANAAPDGPNIPLSLAAAASVKFYYDHKSHWVTDNQTSAIAVAAGNFQSELGCSGDWDPACLRSWLQDPDGDGTYSFTTTSIPAGNYEAKVAMNESWDVNYGAGGVQDGPNIPFTVPSGNARVDFTFDPGSHVLTITVLAPTSTAIVSDAPDPSVVGQSVTVQYSVAPAGGGGSPTGNVTVSDGTISCTGTVAAGQCSLTFTSAGAESLTATYAGDSNFNGSSSAAPEGHTVTKANTTTTVTSDNPDPSTVGQSVTVQYNVTVNGPGAGTPTGNVTVSDGVDSCTATVAAGQCSITLTTVGSRTLTATYAVSANFNASTSSGNPHTVNPPNTAPTATVTNGQCSATNMASGTITLTLADADGDPLTFTFVSSSNTTLVPNANVVLDGSGNNRTLTVTGAAKKSGMMTLLTLNLSDGTDTVSVLVTVKIGTAKNETLNGTPGIDMLFGLAGKNTLNGDAGNDLLCGGNSNDTLSGGNGNDILDGGNGDDVLSGDNDNDILRGASGNDALTGGTGADSFSGGAGTDSNTDFTVGDSDTSDGS